MFGHFCPPKVQVGGTEGVNVVSDTGEQPLRKFILLEVWTKALEDTISILKMSLDSCHLHELHLDQVSHHSSSW